MVSSPDSVRQRLVDAVEHCYYSGATAGQMWLHDLSAYLRSLPSEDGRLDRLAHAGGDPVAAAEEHLCTRPHPLVQAFDAGAWLDEYVQQVA